MISSGSGFARILSASSGSRATQTRVSNPSTASAPSFNSRWVIAKLDRLISVMVV